MFAMLKSLRVTVLVFTLTCSVFAGDIPNNAIPTPPPPPPPTATSGAGTTAGQLSTDQPLENTIAEVVLNVLTNVLSLF